MPTSSNLEVGYGYAVRNCAHRFECVDIGDP